MKQKTKARRVNYLANPDDLEVLVLARLGQHTNAIARKTGMTPSQAQYRILHGNCKGIRRDFREGLTAEFKMCLGQLGPVIGDKITKNIKKLIAHNNATPGWIPDQVDR